MSGKERKELGGVGQKLTLWVKPVAPFHLGLTVWALRRRPANVIDRWDGQTYRRVLVCQGQPFEVAVSESRQPDCSRLRVILTGARLDAETRTMARGSLERLLGLKIDLRKFHHLAAADAKLGPLAKRFRGVKPPRFPTLFEAAVNAVACQQMSLTVGIILLGRLAAKFGVTMGISGESACAFPRPEDLVKLTPADLRALGFSLQKGRVLIALAHVWQENGSDWEKLERLEDQAAVERLLQLRGIGRWSAEYVLLRGLGRLNVYPGDDVGARNNLRRWLKLRKPLDYEGVRRVVGKWQPYAGLVYFHMLLDRLAAAGYLMPLKGADQAEA